MAIATGFAPRPVNSAQYDECVRLLKEFNAGRPPGRLYHACYINAGQLNVVDVWDSPESFAQLGITLTPMLQELGIDAGEPAISQIHNITN